MAFILTSILVLWLMNFIVPYLSVYKNLKTDVHLQRNCQSAPTILVTKTTELNNELDYSCETIHIGFVCAGYKSSLYLHAQLKSLYFYRSNPLHFHILANKSSVKVLSVLFATWKVPKVNVTFYDINDHVLDVRWVPNYHYSGIFGLLKLIFPKVIPLDVTNKIIVLDTDLTIVSDIYELWKLFDDFNSTQALGIVENESEYYLGTISKSKPWPALGRGFNSGVLLYNLRHLKKLNWQNLWTMVGKYVAITYGSTHLGDQDIINAVIVNRSDILYKVPCYWNTQFGDHSISHECYNKYNVKIIHWNSPKKIGVSHKDGEYFRTFYTTFLEYNGYLLRRQLLHCNSSDKNFDEGRADVCSEFNRAKTGTWRTLLFFRGYDHVPAENDVTFLAQLSFDRLQKIEDLVRYWQGPISLTLYITDPELQYCINFIENSDLLQDRNNIAYHAVFKDGEYHPINILRNVGLNNVNTPYVFLADIDFLPIKNLYFDLKKYLSLQKNAKQKALIIPAFETQRYRSRIPKNKIQLLGMLEKKTVFPFRSDVWAAGHAPTNYTKWKSATEPYKVKWAPDFEPYIVVASGVTPYDRRFSGFGWNKVSHIMELEAQGYEWVVLPNAFIIHKPHAPSYDIAKFRSSPVYRMCLQNLKEEFIRDLSRKYGRAFDRNSSFLLDEK